MFHWKGHNWAQLDGVVQEIRPSAEADCCNGQHVLPRQRLLGLCPLQRKGDTRFVIAQEGS
ncbi:hypothetical protein M513_11228 [Trichuris suis]|uniref:Uncharacterized protein n=1 Tax=Trichuris suis TaxID=68888 RepID=A0A085LSC9_9BILA|nr:hypothetical protein M513_11228 [Trichuris suis]